MITEAAKIEEQRHAGCKLSKTGDRHPVIVYNPHINDYGIQFWTDRMIKEGRQHNTDKTISIYIEKLNQ